MKNMQYDILENIDTDKVIATDPKNDYLPNKSEELEEETTRTRVSILSVIALIISIIAIIINIFTLINRQKYLEEAKENTVKERVAIPCYESTSITTEEIKEDIVYYNVEIPVCDEEEIIYHNVVD